MGRRLKELQTSTVQSSDTKKDQDSEMVAAMGPRKDLVRADGSKVKCLLHEWLSLDPHNPHKKLGYGVSLYLQY